MKKFFFILLMPLMVPLGLLLNSTYEWWSHLSDTGAGIQKLLFFILFPIYAPLAFFLYYAFPAWADLAK